MVLRASCPDHGGTGILPAAILQFGITSNTTEFRCSERRRWTWPRISSGLGMTIFESTRPLAWGELDVPLFGLGQDWYGARVEPAAGFALVCDAQRLWFVASHRRPAVLHPQARPGLFQAELWRYDVAELFLADPHSGRYFEFNLAPNGAWWSCEFTAPRVRAEVTDLAMPEVATFSELAEDGSWVAALALPLDLLRARLDFGPATKANVTFILETPRQRFLTATKLESAAADFHQPEHFAAISRQALPRLSPQDARLEDTREENLS